MKKIIISFLFILSLIIQTVRTQTFVHPGIPFTRNDLDQLKENIAKGKEPWASMYTSFASDAKSKLSYNPATPPSLVSRTPDINLTQWRDDSRAIFQLSLMWYFTGDTAYGGKATRLLDAWAVNNVQWAGEESFLDIGDYIEYLVPGADILKSTYPGWTAENTSHVNNYFTNVIWPELDVPHPVRPMNQGAIQLKAAISIAAFLDDSEKWQQAIFSLRYDPAGGLANSLENGQVGDAGRDEGHWRGQVLALAWSAEVAWKQGVDIFSELENRILKAVELYARGPAGVNYIPFGGPYAFYTGFTNNANNQNGPAWNIVNGAYTLRKGIACPYTDRLRSLVGNNIYTWLYLKSADNSTAKPPVSIVSPSVNEVNNLTNYDIGNTGMAGSSGLTNGVWRVTGAGKGVEIPYRTQPDALNFAFEQVTGDASVIAKFNSYEEYEEAAQFGLMIREDLTPESRYATVLFTGSGGLVTTWRGADAWNKTNISWNFSASRGSQTMSSAGRYPHWLKLERIGNRVVLSHAIDSIHWSNISVVDIPLSTSAYIGLAAASGNTSALNIFEFSSVYITNPSPPGSPVITSLTKTEGVLGSAFNYTIEGSNNPSGYSAIGLPAGVSLTNNTISGIPAETGTFFVTLGVSNSSGSGTATLVITIASSSAPASPTGITTVATDNYVGLKWDATPNATSYRIKRALTAGGPYTTVADVTGTSYNDVTAYAGNDNYYVITAFSGQLEGSPSAEVSIAVLPQTPTDISVTNALGKVTLNWPEATGAISYNIKRALVSGGAYTTLASDVKVTSYSDEGLTNGTIYYYVVSSAAPQGESANSLEIVGVPGSTSATWVTKPTSKNWSTGVNWEGGNAPVSPSILSFGQSDTTMLNNDLTNLQASHIDFSSAASAFTINGNAISPGTEITNNSTSTQVINLPFTLNNKMNVNPKSGAITLGGIISGTGSLNINHQQDKAVVLSGMNTYSGGTLIYGGWNGSWGSPTYSTAISGTGTASAGPLGTGPVHLHGGTLVNNGVYAKIYNDVYLDNNTDNYCICNPGGLEFAGNLYGEGNLSLEVSSGYPYYTFSGNNSNFKGKFTTIKRSGYFRMTIATADAGSAQAKWEFNPNFNADACRFAFTGTINFGEFAGEGSIKQFSGSPVISMGALNTDATFSGVASNSLSFIKVGTGTQRFTGINSYTGTTTVNEGKFYVNGSVVSPVIVNGGIFGGIGSTTATVTVNTGGTLAPGDNGIGRFKTTGALTMSAGAAFNVEINSTNGASDKLLANGVTLNNATLNLTDLEPGTLPLGTNLLIIDNTSGSAVSGTFNGLAEHSVLTLGSNNYVVTYLGGTGNDVLLLDQRTAPAVITSSAQASGKVGTAFTYTITATNTPTTFTAAGLPAGLTLDAASGVISGTPAQSGVFNVSLGATTGIGNASLAAVFTIVTNVVPDAPTGVIANGVTVNQMKISWNKAPVKDFVTKYTIKSSTTDGGPYTTVAANLIDTFYIQSGLTFNTSYYYVVSATNIVGEGANSLQYTGITSDLSLPSVPKGIVSYPSGTSIGVSWGMSPSIENVTSYNLKRSDSQGGPYVTVYSGSAVSYTDNSVVDGNTYYYVVSALNVKGESANSSEIKANTTEKLNSGVLYFPMNDNTGTTTTEVLNSKNGTMTGAGATWTNGISGSALNLNGSTSYVSLSSGIVSSLKDFTISCWIKPSAYAKWGRIFDFGTGTGNYMFLSANNGSTTNNTPRYGIIKTGGSEQGITSSVSLTSDKWANIVVTQLGQTVIMYVNGIEVGRNTAVTYTPSQLGTTTANYFGKSQWSGDAYLNSVIDEIRFYNRALTFDEVRDIAKTGVTLNAPDNIAASGKEKNVNVSWTPSLGAVSYTVRRATTNDGPYTTVASGITSTSYTDTKATVGDYFYYVTAVANDIESVPSNVAGISFAPSAPTNVIATGWNNCVDLSWALVSGAKSYNVMRAIVSGGPYSLIKNVPTSTWRDSSAENGTTYYYVISSIAASYSSSNSNEVSAIPVENAVTSEWLHNDVGAVGISGNAAYNNGIFSIYGSGSDLINQTDAYHIMYKKLSGNAAIVAHIVDQQNTATFAKAGVIISDTLAANTVNAANVSLPSGIKEFTYRTGTTTNSVETFYDDLTTGYEDATSANWLRLVRTGDIFISYYSENGINWTLQKSQSLIMKGNIFVGILNCAANNSAINTSAFDSVQISSTLPVFATYKDTTGVYRDTFQDTVFVSENPYYFGANGLPQGLSINTSNGIISGMPAETGIFPVIFTAVNAMGSDTLLKTFVISKADQSITFDAISNKKVNDVDFDPIASASSGLALSYSTSDINVATIVNGKVHIVGSGTCIIYADQQGDENYNAATQVSQNLTVNKLDQTITFAALPEKHVGEEDFNPGASASSGLQVTYSSSNSEVAVILNNKIHLVGAGSSTITASQPGNATYDTASPVEQTLTVKKGNQTGHCNLPKGHFRFFPNPVKDKICIQTGILATENARILIYNQRGVLILEKKVNSTIETFDLGKIPTGVYFLKYEDGENVFTQKFIKI